MYEIGGALIGKVEIAIRRKDEIVRTPERLAKSLAQYPIDTSVRRIDKDKPHLAIGNEEPAVTMDLQAVRFAIIFGDLLERSVLADA
jgi:hypothetical protein